LYGERVLEEGDDAVGDCIVVYAEFEPIGPAEGKGQNIIVIGDVRPFFGYGGDDLFVDLAGGVTADGVILREGGGAEGEEVDGGSIQDEVGTFENAIFYLMILPDFEGEMAGGGGYSKGIGWVMSE
jgi:hypothetical protein